MKIENGSLVVTVNGLEKTVPLPTVAADAKVKAWAVPADYRADGLFVAVTVKGESEEIPACDLAACEFLGELELDAGDDAKLEAVKAAKRAGITEDADAPVKAERNDREKLIEELRAERDAQTKAASEAAQEAEAEAWLARKREAEAAEEKIDPESGFI